MFKIKPLIFALFFMASFSFASPSPITVSYLYKVFDKDKNVHRFLFPITSDYLKQVTKTYNASVSSSNQINHVFISQIFRSREEQRQALFDYILNKKDFFNFIRLYDKKNEQFAIQLLNITQEAFHSKSTPAFLLGGINKDVDKVLKSPYQEINHTFISNYLLKVYGLSPASFSASIDSIKTISANALKEFQINDSFLKATKIALQEKIQQKYSLSPELALKSATENMALVITKNIFEYMHPLLKKQGYKLFSNPKIGTKLSVWFSNVTVYSHHGIPSLSDAELLNLEKTLQSGKKFIFAIDLGMKTNKSIDGQSAVWNIDNKNNQLSALKKALETNFYFTTHHYDLIFLKKQLKMDHSELAVHIELSIQTAQDKLDKDISQEMRSVENDSDKNKDVSPPLLNSSQTTNTTPSENPPVKLPTKNIIESSSASQKFENPSDKDKNQTPNNPNAIRKINLKTYDAVLGNAYKGDKKPFENSNKKK